PAAEDSSQEAARIRAESDEQSERGDTDAGLEGPEIDKGAADEHQCPDSDECERHDVCGIAHRGPQTVGDLPADDAPVPAEVDDGHEDEADRNHPEPPELGMVMRSGLARALLDARGGPRPQRSLPGPARTGSHGARFDAAEHAPCRGGYSIRSVF